MGLKYSRLFDPNEGHGTHPRLVLRDCAFIARFMQTITSQAAVLRQGFFSCSDEKMPGKQAHRGEQPASTHNLTFFTFLLIPRSDCTQTRKGVDFVQWTNEFAGSAIVHLKNLPYVPREFSLAIPQTLTALFL
jgi:hypothetical protein